MGEAQDLYWERVCLRDDVPAGGVLPVKVGPYRLAVCDAGGEVHLVDNACPHRGGPLARGRMEGSELACPWHRFRFDPVTGRATMPEDLPAATTYPVRVEDGWVHVGVAEPITTGVNS